MLTAFRRHRADCKYKAKGRAWKRCDCPVWADGSMVNGKRPLISLKTVEWDAAQKKLLELNSSGQTELNPDQIRVVDAITHYMKDCTARNLSTATISSYQTFANKLTEFAQDRGIHYLRQFNITNLEQLRHTWDFKPSTVQKALLCLSTFFTYAVDHGWLTKNPARAIKPPRNTEVPTQPYTPSEIAAILKSIDEIAPKLNKIKDPHPAPRLRALCLVMRYSGLRISDAVNVTTDHFNGDRLFLRNTQKTGAPISCVVPQAVLDALDQCPKLTPNRWFSMPNEHVKPSVARSIQRYRYLFDKVCEHAGVSTEFHTFHRLRDSFAVSLLEAGVPIDQVSKMLGHTSVKTTEKHYAPWVQGRQARLDAELARVNANDPLLKSLSAPALLRRVK